MDNGDGKDDVIVADNEEYGADNSDPTAGFPSQFINELKSRDPSIMEAIRNDGELKPETEKKLVAFLDNFSKSFT